MGVVCKASFNTPPPGTSPTHSPLLRPGRTLTLCAAYSESEDPGLPLHYTWPYLAQVTWSTCKLLPHTLPPPQEVFGVCSGVEVQGLLCHFLCVRGKAFHLSLHLPSAKWLRFPAPQELSCVWKAPAVESAGPMSGVMIVVRVLCLALPSRLVPQGQPHSLVLLANFYTQLYRHQNHQSWFCEAAWLMEITGALSLVTRDNDKMTVLILTSCVTFVPWFAQPQTGEEGGHPWFQEWKPLRRHLSYALPV